MEENKSYEEQIKDIIRDSREEIQRKTQEALKQKIIDSISWSLGSIISEIVKETIETELKEEIQKEVINCKSELIKQIKPTFSNAGAKLAMSMEQKLEETFTSSYKANNIIKELFN